MQDFPTPKPLEDKLTCITNNDIFKEIGIGTHLLVLWYILLIILLTLKHKFQI